MFKHSFPGIDCIPRKDPKDPPPKVGGPDSCTVEPHSQPWTVRLPDYYNENEPEIPLDIHNEKTFKCGGTLIAKNLVLTTADCLCERTQETPTPATCTKWRHMKAMVGEHNIRDEEDQQIVEITDMILHPNYTGIESICNH